MDATYGIVVYTDGCCLGNNRKTGRSGGVGVVFPSYPQYNIGEYYDDNITNNRAELYAILRSLEIIDVSIDPFNMKSVCIKTDSQLCVNALTKWMKSWKRNGWKLSTGEPPSNMDILKKINTHMDKRRCTFIHVRGHRTDASIDTYYNTMADALANRGAAAGSTRSVASA